MKTVRLRENVGVKFTDDSCEIHGPRGLRLQNLDTEQRGILRLLVENGLALDSVSDQSPSIRKLLQTLSDNKLLRLHESDYSRNEIWLSHYVPDAREAFRSLSVKTVLIAGCGGTGAIVADHLARAGVRKFILIDNAELDAPDLNRQWPFSKGDIGRPKVEVLAEHLRAINGAESVVYKRFLQDSESLSGIKEPCDLIVWCADKPQWTIELLGLELAERLATPILFGAVGIADDSVGAVLSDSAARSRERARLEAAAALNLESSVIEGSICFTNTLTAAKLALTAFRHLLRLG